MHLTSQNDQPTDCLSWQMAILAGHRLLTGGYFEPCYLPGSVGCTDFQKYP